MGIAAPFGRLARYEKKDIASMLSSGPPAYEADERRLGVDGQGSPAMVCT
jgi:hypothetical protein